MPRGDAFWPSCSGILFTVCFLVCSSPSADTEMTATLCANQMCFLLTDARNQYGAAQNACATLNEGRLISIQSEEKWRTFESLRRFLASSTIGMDYWLGLVNTPGLRDWKWSDPNQSQVTFDSWKGGEPDPGDAVAFADGNDHWISTHAHDEHFTFCEYSLTTGGLPMSPSPSSGPSTSPPQPYVHSKDTLYLRTTYLTSSLASRISSSRSVMECASCCSGAITCYGFSFHLSDNACIMFNFDHSAQSPIPDCTFDQCYRKMSLLNLPQGIY